MYSNYSKKSDDLTSSIKNFSKTFNLGDTFQECGLKKLRGIPVMRIFYYLFGLIFRGRTLNRDQIKNHMEDSECKVKKDTCHRFLQSLWTDWNKLLATLSNKIMEKLSCYRPKDSKGVTMPLMYVIDDSSFYRNRSNRVELLARNYDHANHKFFKGFRMLTLGVTDSKTITPVAFCNLSNKDKDKRITQEKKIDKKYKNSFGKKIREIAKMPMTEALLELLDVGIQCGIKAKYVLCDRWFSSPKTIISILAKKLHVITMLKNDRKKYIFRNEEHTLSQIFKILVKEARVLRKQQKLSGNKDFNIKGYLYSTDVEIKSSNDSNLTYKVRLVFVRNKNNKSEYLTLLCTDTDLDEKQIIERYGSRWAIETLFQTLKSFLNLQKSTQSIDYTEIHASTSIAMIQFMMLSYEKRLNSDEASYGELFLSILEEVQDEAFMDMFNLLLLEFCNHLAENCHLPIAILLQQVDLFMKNLPTTLKNCLNSNA